MIQYDLNDYTKNTDDTQSLLTQCRKIVQAAYHANNDSSNAKNIALMTQINMLMPKAYQCLKKKNNKNLQAALTMLTNRGTKTDEEIKRDITFIGNNNEKKKFLYGKGIIEVRTTQADLVHTIYQANAKAIDEYLKSKKAQRCSPAQITEDLIIAYAAARGNAALFDLYLNYKDDSEYLRALDQPEKIAEDRAKLAFKEGDCYCQALLIQHYLNAAVHKINFENKGSHPTVYELAQCLANLNTRAQREAVVAYYNQFGSTPSFQHLFNAAAAIKRDEAQLDETQRNLLYDFLIAKMQTGTLSLTTDEPDITDLCIYYNENNMHSSIGTVLIEKRKQEEATTYAKIAKILDELFKDKPDCNTALDEHRDELVYILGYYQDNEDSLQFIKQYIKKNIYTDSDLNLFHTRIMAAHQRVIVYNDKSLLKLEFQAPNTSPYAKLISKLDHNTYDFYDRIIFAQQFADAFNNYRNELFLFAFNHPDIAVQYTDIETLAQIIDIQTQGHDMMQLQLFISSIPINEEVDYDDPNFDDNEQAALENLINSIGSSSMHAQAPVASKTTKPTLDQIRRIKRYVTAFYLIHFSEYDVDTKNQLKASLALQYKNIDITRNDVEITDLTILASRLFIDTRNLINLNDDWSVISDDDAKIFSSIFNQEVKSKADLVYAFYYFNHYPFHQPLQQTLHTAIKNYLKSKDRILFLDTIIRSGLDTTGKYSKEIEKLKQKYAINAEIAKRVQDPAKQRALFQFFTTYPVLQKAIMFTNQNWADMHTEICAFTNSQKVNAQEMDILVEIALLYPGLLMGLPLPAHLQAYKKLATEFEFIKDDVTKRQLIVELCKNPNYKQTLLAQLRLNRKFIAKPHHKDERKLKDDLLAIHFEYGCVFSNFFLNIDDDKFSYIHHESMLTVKKLTDQYLLNNLGNDKTEAFLIHLHFLQYGDIRRELVPDEFIARHKAFSKIKLDIPHVERLNLRNIMVELDLHAPGLMTKFATEVTSNPDATIRKYKCLHGVLKLMRSKRENFNIDRDFEQNPLFILYTSIYNSDFLTKREKTLCYNVFIDNKNYNYAIGNPLFIKLIQMFGVYPLLLKMGNISSIKKHSQRLNEKIGLKDHKNLPYINVSYADLMSLANSDKAVIKRALKAKESDKLNAADDIANAQVECDKFYDAVFPSTSKNLSIYNDLYQLELAIPGILSDIFNQFSSDIDDVLNENNQ
ncbi:MAG: hypothetical protein ABSF18_05780, partial [Gammaproteobacteria bacterium]